MNKKLFTPFLITIVLALLVSACDPIQWPWMSRVEKANVEATIAADALKATQIVAALTPGAPTSAPGATPGATPNVPSGIVSLNYDNAEANGNCMTTSNAASDPLMPNQTKYGAYYICVANTAGQKQSDLEAAIVAIQQEANAAGAKTLSGKKITLDNETAWLVWIPNAATVDYTTVPNDTAYPASLKHPAQGQIWIVPPFAAGVNGRTFQNADYEFWAVAVH